MRTREICKKIISDVKNLDLYGIANINILFYLCVAEVKIKKKFFQFGIIISADSKVLHFLTGIYYYNTYVIKLKCFQLFPKICRYMYGENRFRDTVMIFGMSTRLNDCTTSAKRCQQKVTHCISNNLIYCPLLQYIKRIKCNMLSVV